jgi:ABC-2 type transport system permease protein
MIRLLGHYVRYNLSAGMEYRTSFLVQVFGMVLNNSAFIVFWLILFQRIGGSIRGYGFQDVMFLWSLAALGFGIAAVFAGNSYSISRIIYQGELDVYLLQPKPVLPNLLFSRMIISGWGDMCYGIILFLCTQPLRLDKILLFILFSILMATVLVSLRVLYHSLTFFLGNAEQFAATASELVLSFMLYPGTIFEGPVTWLLHSLLPAALVAYIPVSIFNEFDALRLLWLIAADFLVLLAAIGLFHLGLRMYESGNRIGTRI